MHDEYTIKPGVALLAEGVDRNNFFGQIRSKGLIVALLAEGVDRNTGTASPESGSARSPSSRRAWIEISWRNPLHP